jgi:hypothetical protein
MLRLQFYHYLISCILLVGVQLPPVCVHRTSRYSCNPAGNQNQVTRRVIVHDRVHYVRPHRTPDFRSYLESAKNIRIHVPTILRERFGGTIHNPSRHFHSNQGNLG